MTTAAEHRLATISTWTEKQFQAQVVGLAKQLGWMAYHTYDSRRSEPGYPDLTLVHPQHGLIFAELKTEKGRVSPEQREWLEVLSAVAFPYPLISVYTWRPRHWADRTIHEALNPGGLHT